MSTFRVGQMIQLEAGAALPYGTRLAHNGGGWFAITVKPLVVGDVIDTEEQAARLPIGSVVVSTGADALPAGRAPAVKVDDEAWMFYTPEEKPVLGDDGFVGDECPHRIVHIPDADAGAGSQAA